MNVMIVVAIFVLILHWKGPNAVWGGATLGLIVGVIAVLVFGNRNLLGLIFVIGTFSGAAFEWIGRLTDRFCR